MGGCSCVPRTRCAPWTARSSGMAGLTTSSLLARPTRLRAARRTAQLAFERVLFEHGEEEVTTADILRGIGETRRTLTPELVAEFEQDIEDYARV